MPKSNLLILDIADAKTKKLGETITNETSKKILNHLSDKEETEMNIAKQTSIPLSTVHYHLQKLQEAGLVTVDEFHYSQKGREVNHYKLASKCVIITHNNASEVRDKLKDIFIAILAVGVIGFFITLVQQTSKMASMSKASVPMIQEAMTATAATASEANMLFYFILGASTIILALFFVLLVRYYCKRK